MNDARPSVIYLGTREAMIDEVNAWDPACIGISAKESRYLIMPYGDAAFTTEWRASKRDAKALAKEMGKENGVRVQWID